MTKEGIIQKVFRQYTEHNKILFQAELYNKSTKKILFEIQQKLITEIKNKENLFYSCDSIPAGTPDAIFLEDLIGDIG